MLEKFGHCNSVGLYDIVMVGSFSNNIPSCTNFKEVLAFPAGHADRFQKRRAFEHRFWNFEIFKKE